MNEIWKDVPGWEGFYEVSDQGRVRSLDRKIWVKNAQGMIGERNYTGKVLTPNASKNGYLMVSLTAPQRDRKYAYIHELVTLAFLGPRSRGQEVCHGDGTRTHNTLENLRYDTRSANALDRIAHGTMNPKRGTDNANSKLTEGQVRWLRSNPEGLSLRAMGRRLGITHKTVGDIIKGRWWSHLR